MIVVDLKPSSLIILETLKKMGDCPDPIPMRLLSEKTHLSYPTVRRHIRLLSTLDIISIHREAGCAWEVRLTPKAFLSLAYRRQYGARYARFANY
jgi:hypothetical protein